MQNCCETRLHHHLHHQVEDFVKCAVTKMWVTNIKTRMKDFEWLTGVLINHTLAISACERCTYRTRAGVSAQFGRLLAGGRALGADAGIVLRVDPLHLAGGLLERVEAALRALHSHLLVLRDGVQGLDDRVCSLAAACGHLCDTYLSKWNRGERKEGKR